MLLVTIENNILNWDYCYIAVEISSQLKIAQNANKIQYHAKIIRLILEVVVDALDTNTFPHST